MRTKLIIYFLFLFQLKFLLSRGELNLGLRLVYEIEYE
jgi:hypothetical protein